MIKVKENPALVRDEHSKAILNNDVAMFNEFKSKKSYFLTLSSRIERLENQINKLTELVEKINSKSN